MNSEKSKSHLFFSSNEAVWKQVFFKNNSEVGTCKIIMPPPKNPFLTQRRSRASQHLHRWNIGERVEHVKRIFVGTTDISD